MKKSKQQKSKEVAKPKITNTSNYTVTEQPIHKANGGENVLVGHDYRAVVVPVAVPRFSIAQLAPEPPKEISDPFFSQNACVERLYAEYKKHGQLIVAVDFDETIFPYKDKNVKYTKVIDLLRDCFGFGFYIVIYTASDPKRFPKMKEYLEQYGIAVSAVNKNPIKLPFGNHGKMYYNILLDDRAGLSSAYNVLREVVEKIKVENV